MKADAKTLIIGFLLGALFVCALGALGGADKADFGIAIPPQGSVLVKAENGQAYIIDGRTGTAKVVRQPVATTTSALRLF